MMGRVALRFAAEGAAVVIADVDEVAGGRVVGEIEGDGGHAVSVVMDVSDAEAAVAMVDRAGALLERRAYRLFAEPELGLGRRFAGWTARTGERAF